MSAPRDIPKTVAHRLSIERLHELFELDEETGVLRWRVSPARSVKVGDMVGGDARSGRTFYRLVKIEDVRYKAHHIVWAMTHGVWPEHDIDHIDHNGLNNAPANLRLATDSQNGANGRPREGCTSRFKGVHWCATVIKWRSQIQYTIHIGYFADERLAALHYDAAHKLCWPGITNPGALNFPPEESDGIELSPPIIARIEAARADTSKLKMVHTGDERRAA